MNPQGSPQHDSLRSRGLPGGKRWFDLAFCLSTAVLWLPLALTGMLAVLIGSGWPAVYVSSRVVYRGERARVIKLRAMVRNAAAIANRRTVPIGSQRFLNIAPDSELYTPVGRVIERLYLTEITQFFHVLTGTMSVIGNRPLPADVVEALSAAYPEAEERFLTRAGLTGPAQLVGRAALTDEERLGIEIAYCRHCLRGYSMRLDAMIILYTVLILARMRKSMTAPEVATCMAAWAGLDEKQAHATPRAAVHAAVMPAVVSKGRTDEALAKEAAAECRGEG
jgi:lipopolysaccharide/colanic/teichoic acid biosynthesis glycosyltransferase